jgi:hypothetical protein
MQLSAFSLALVLGIGTLSSTALADPGYDYNSDYDNGPHYDYNYNYESPSYDNAGDYVWVEGRWNWNDGRWIWTDGHYEHGSYRRPCDEGYNSPPVVYYRTPRLSYREDSYVRRYEYRPRYVERRIHAY